MTGPILVTGADRSGTTLLYTLLASHPRIMMVRRTNLWRWFDRRFGDLANPDNLSRCLELMIRYERLSVLSLDPDAIVRDFNMGEPTYGRLFEIVFSQQAARLGFPRWGDKSLHTELAAERVFAAWPGARMIQVIRDPRDRYLSVLGRAGPDTGRDISIVARWIRSTRAAERNLDRYNGRYMVLRYEDLVANPYERTKEVCDFIGETFNPVMMQMRGGDQRSLEGGNSSFDTLPPGVISARSVGRYRSALPARKVAFIEYACRSSMQTLGYELDYPVLGSADKLRYFGDIVDGTFRIPAWLLNESLAERRTRGVPHHRLVDRVSEET
jgi:hypothetical protein